jgi:hypothetical protein
MINCIKNLLRKQPDVILSSKGNNLFPESRHITFARCRRIGSRRVVEHNGDMLLLNGDGTVSGHYAFTHWEKV